MHMNFKVIHKIVSTHPVYCNNSPGVRGELLQKITFIN